MDENLWYSTFFSFLLLTIITEESLDELQWELNLFLIWFSYRWTKLKCCISLSSLLRTGCAPSSVRSVLSLWILSNSHSCLFSIDAMNQREAYHLRLIERCSFTSNDTIAEHQYRNQNSSTEFFHVIPIFSRKSLTKHRRFSMVSSWWLNFYFSVRDCPISINDNSKHGLTLSSWFNKFSDSIWTTYRDR